MTTEVVYKPNPKSTDEFKIIVNHEEYNKWKAGQKDGWKEGETKTTVQDVVAGGGVLHSGQGKQGIQGTPSKQQLDTIFGTHDTDGVVEIILEKGTVQAAHGIGKHTPITNAARGSGTIDSKGKGLTGI
jgi:ribosome maturation protein Sdo1